MHSLIGHKSAGTRPVHVTFKVLFCLYSTPVRNIQWTLSEGSLRTLSNLQLWMAFFLNEGHTASACLSVKYIVPVHAFTSQQMSQVKNDNGPGLTSVVFVMFLQYSSPGCQILATFHFAPPLCWHGAVQDLTLRLHSQLKLNLFHAPISTE